MPEPSSSSSSSSSSESCRIRWADGTELNDSNRKVLPGQSIKLQVVCDGKENWKIRDVNWSLPGEVFREYTPTSAKAKVEKMRSQDLNNRTVSFYWSDVGNDREVKVSFRILFGSLRTATAKFHVLDPTVTPAAETPVHGEIVLKEHYIVQDEDLGPGVQFFVNDPKIAQSDNRKNGIVFEASVTPPPEFKDFTPSEWAFCQLVNADRGRTHESGDCEEILSEETVLDGRFPMAALQHAIFPDDGRQRMQVDSPGQSLMEDYKQYTADDRWKTYILFKPTLTTPGGGLSAWVALRSVYWSWLWCAHKDSEGAWSLEQKIATVGEWEIDRAQPEWRKNLQDDGIAKFREGPCRPPCAPSSSSNTSSSSSGG